MNPYNIHLIPSWATLAQSLACYVNASGLALHPEIVNIAYQQVVKEGEISFGQHEEAIRAEILHQINANFGAFGSRLFDIIDGEDFDWPLHRHCIEICDTHNLTLTNFRYLKPPMLPTLIKQDLELLTVSDIKKIFKDNGYLTTGNREELVDRLWLHLPIKQTEEMLLDKYQQKMAVYQKRQLKKKFELLVSHIKQRGYFLRYIAQNGGMTGFGSYVAVAEFSTAMCSADDFILAKHLDGTGYGGVLVGGQINKLLPLFPYDFSSIMIKNKKM